MKVDGNLLCSKQLTSSYSHAHGIRLDQLKAVKGAYGWKRLQGKDGGRPRVVGTLEAEPAAFAAIAQLRKSVTKGVRQEMTARVSLRLPAKPCEHLARMGRQPPTYGTVD